MRDIRLNDASAIPVFQQIVEQIIFMIGSGELGEGDRLPASRLLADVDVCDVVVVPSENPDLAEQIAGRVETIEFGNVLDAASKRMVAETVGDLRERHRSAGSAPPVTASQDG